MKILSNHKTEYNNVTPYVTKDNSKIRELMHPSIHENMNQSLAEATLLSGRRTFLHKHHLAEEIYHITEGIGIMILGSETFEVKKGDTIYIAPGTPHRIQNTGKGLLKILCCCSPAYSHEDTELLE